MEQPIYEARAFAVSCNSGEPSITSLKLFSDDASPQSIAEKFLLQFAIWPHTILVVSSNEQTDEDITRNVIPAPHIKAYYYDERDYFSILPDNNLSAHSS